MTDFPHGVSASSREIEGAGIFYLRTTVHAVRAGAVAVVGAAGTRPVSAKVFAAEHTSGVSLLLRGGDLRKSTSGSPRPPDRDRWERRGPRATSRWTPSRVTA